MTHPTGGEDGTAPPDAEVDFGVGGIAADIFQSQAALARTYAREMREADEFRCICSDGCSRCNGDGFVTR